MGERLIPDEAGEQIRELYKKRLDREVCFKLIKSDDEASERLSELLGELCELSDKLTLEEYRMGENKEQEQIISAERFPTAAVFSGESFSGIKFSGVPLGYEFDSIMIAPLSVGSDDKPDGGLLERIGKIKKPVSIKIGVTLSCQFCPETVVAAQRIASLSENITAEMIDVTLFTDFAREHGIMSVPAVIINDGSPEFGARSADELLDLIEEVSE